MKEGASERLSGCISVEVACARLYKRLAGVFPGSAEFFEELSASEQNHANLLSIGSKLDIGSLPPDSGFPSLPMIERTLGMVASLEEGISRKEVALETALEKALLIEKSTAESYFYELMKKETDSAVVSMLQRFYGDEKRHAEVLLEYMEKLGPAG